VEGIIIQPTAPIGRHPNLSALGAGYNDQVAGAVSALQPGIYDIYEKVKQWTEIGNGQNSRNVKFFYYRLENA
jgi:hypothetical protein